MNPPVYDIHDFAPRSVGSPSNVRSIDLTQRLEQLISMDGTTYRPDSALLRTEIIFRDAMHFDTSMGNGFANLLGYSDGRENFARALVAVREIGVSRQYELLLQAKKIVESHGLVFPEPVPENWKDGYDIDYDLKMIIDKETSRLSEQYWETFGSDEHDIHHALLRYMNCHASELEIRTQ